MKQIRRIEVNGVLNVLYDDLHIFLLQKHVDFIRVRVLNLQLEEIAYFDLQYHFHPYISGLVDQNALYLPTKDGLVIIIDKFTGESFKSIDTSNSPWISSPKIIDNHICVAGAIPTSNGQYIKINSLVMMVYSEDDKYQSRTISGSRMLFSVHADRIHTVTGTEYNIFDLRCSLIQSVTIPKDVDYDPMVSPNRTYLAAESGILNIVRESQVQKYFIAPSSTAPLYDSSQDVLYWFTKHGIYKIDKGVNRLLPIKKDFVFSGLCENKMIGITTDSEIYVVDKNTLKEEIIVAEKGVAFPHLIGNHIISLFGNTLCSLEISLD